MYGTYRSSYHLKQENKEISSRANLLYIQKF